MNCPIDNAKMHHFPNDDIRNYECSKCGLMLRQSDVDSLTDEKKKKMRDSHFAFVMYNQKRRAEQIAKSVLNIRDEYENAHDMAHKEGFTDKKPSNDSLSKFFS
jgi:Zn ribbon nucleic-acid-binding protein